MIEYTLPVDKKRAGTASCAMEPKALEELVETQKPNFLKAIGKRATPYMLALGITGLAAVAARADITIPFIEPATTITLTNPTQETVTGKVNYVRIDGTNNETVNYTIPANGSVTVENPVTVANPLMAGPYATVVPDVDSSTGTQFSDPEVNVVTCDNGKGYTLPTWTKEQLQNTKQMSGVSVTGEEYLLIASGDQECTVTLEYYGTNGNGPFYSTPIHFGPHEAVTAKINQLEGGVHQNSPFNVLLDSASQSNARVAELRVDDTTLDKSVSDLKPYTAETPVDQYDTTVQIFVFDNDQELSVTATGVHDQTMKDWTGTPDISYLVPHDEFSCTMTPPQMESLIDRYINNLTPAEQNEVTDNSASEALQYFNGGCDANQTKHMYMIMFDLTPK